MTEKVRYTGAIKWFNHAKGYGFILPDAGGKDMFLHISAVQKAGKSEVSDGERLSYEVREKDGKENAINIQFSQK